jgi:hypothetical protein
MEIPTNLKSVYFEEVSVRTQILFVEGFGAKSIRRDFLPLMPYCKEI